MEKSKTFKNLDRRKFLYSSAAAGAGVLLSPVLTTAQTPTNESNGINVALIGAGSQGSELAKIGAKMSGQTALKFRAVCDIWENFNLMRAAAQLKRLGHECNSYTDYKEMLAKEKDLHAVIIATPDFWHAQQTIDCLEAGLHVYCETPMATTLEDADRMVKAARQSGKLLQIGLQRRSNPQYRHCVVNLLNNAQILGRIISLNGQWTTPVQSDLGWPRTREIDPETLKRSGFESMHQLKNWRWYKGLGIGPLGSRVVQQIDVFNWFLNAFPATVSAHGGTWYYDPKTHQWPDTLMSILEYRTATGTVPAMYQGSTTNGYVGNAEIFLGEHGTLDLSETSGRCKIYRDPTNAPKWDSWVDLEFIKSPQVEESSAHNESVLNVHSTKKPPHYIVPEEYYKPPYEPHLQNFFQAIRGEASLNCPADIAYQSIAVLEQVNKAIASGRAVECKSADFVV